MSDVTMITSWNCFRVTCHCCYTALLRKIYSLVFPTMMFVYRTLRKSFNFSYYNSFRALLADCGNSRAIRRELAPLYQGQVRQGNETAHGGTSLVFLRGPFACLDGTSGFWFDPARGCSGGSNCVSVRILHMRSDFLTAVIMVLAFWLAARCRLVSNIPTFWRNILPPSSALKSNVYTNTLFLQN